MNVLILDDENSGRQVLKKLLADYIPDATNVYLAEDFSSAQSILLKREIDVILIDISMPEGTGFDFLDSLNYERYNIVFVTAHQEFALDAIKYRAFDYVLKPVSHLKLIDVFNVIKKRNNTAPFIRSSTNSTEGLKITISGENTYSVYDLEGVSYIEANGPNTTVYFSNGVSKTSVKSIGHYETLLENASFFRIHHSTLINLKKVKSYSLLTFEVVLENNVILSLSKRKKVGFVQAIAQISMR
jgi:two-component system LytT family response regulator